MALHIQISNSTRGGMERVITTINNGGRIGGRRDSHARTSIAMGKVAVLLALTVPELGDEAIETSGSTL